MGLNNIMCDDLVVVEFVKEARILKRQLQLMKNNIEQIGIEDLMKILNITEILEQEIKDLKNKSEVTLFKNGWEVHKHL
ncbi:MAG: hypothetical protein NSGCLCUN01_03653 [uncultured Clostridium sp.]